MPLDFAGALLRKFYRLRMRFDVGQLSPADFLQELQQLEKLHQNLEKFPWITLRERDLGVRTHWRIKQHIKHLQRRLDDDSHRETAQ